MKKGGLGFSVILIGMYFLGGGGVGKSWLIRVISQWIEWLLRKEGDHPGSPTCLLCGPTGVSAALIGLNIPQNLNQSLYFVND